MKQPDTRTAMTIAKGMLSFGFLMAAGFYAYSQLKDDKTPPPPPQAIENHEQTITPKP